LPDPETVASGDSVTIATNGLTNSNANLVANGWNTKADGTGTHYDNGQQVDNINSNLDLYAEWESTLSEYTVTYHANGGTGTVPSAVTVHQGDSLNVQANKLTRSGYSSYGWNTSASGNGIDYDNSASIENINSNIDLYAQWVENVTVTFNANATDATGSMNSQAVPKNIGTTLNSNKFSRPGKKFNKWNTKADGSGVSYTDGDIVNLDNSITLYAQWEEDTGSTNQDNPLGKPAVNKTLEDRNDGTYDLKLSVAGKTNTLTKDRKADVTIIFDNSSSMIDNFEGDIFDDAHSRLVIAKTAITDMTDTLFAQNTDEDPNAVRVSMITFGNHAKVESFPEDSNNYYATTKEAFDQRLSGIDKNSINEIADEDKIASKNTSNSFQGSYGHWQQGTNWEEALRKLSDTKITTNLRENVDHYVIFVSDGDPTLRLTAGPYYKGSDILNYVTDPTQKAQEAAAISNHTDQRERYVGVNNNGNVCDSPWYSTIGTYGTGADIGIFSPPDSHNGYQNVTNITTPSRTNIYRCYNEALDEARKSVSPDQGQGAKLYCISAWTGNNGFEGGGERMARLCAHAYSAPLNLSVRPLNVPEIMKDKYYSANNETALKNAFKDITQKIIGDYYFDDVKITDEITNMTVMESKINDDSNDKIPHELDVRYYKTYKNSSGETVTEEINPAQGEQAYYDSDSKSIKWNPRGGQALEDGVTYSVKCRVWPDQTAYDIVTKLNNKTIKYDDLSTEQRAQIYYKDSEGKYYLKTNGNGYANYDVDEDKTIISGGTSSTTTTKIVDNGKSDPLPTGEIPLTVGKITVRKIWDGVSETDRENYKVTFKIDTDDLGLSTTLTLTKANRRSDNANVWEKTYFVSPGLRITNPDDVILDVGHQYKVTETDVIDTRTNESIKDSFAFTLNFDKNGIKPMLKNTPSNVTYYKLNDNNNLTNNTIAEIEGTNKVVTHVDKLPETGGQGTLLYTLIGLLITGSALVAGVASRRSRRKEGWS
jgi:LPXTG-motif cell wall-anchored protein